MLLAEGRFQNGERALIQRLCPAIQTLLSVEDGEVAERGGEVGVLLPQHLQTDGELGYVVIEVEGQPEQSRETLEEIRALEGTIRARLLYARG